MTSHYYILLQDRPIESKSMISGIANTFIARTNYALKGSLLVFAGRASSNTGAYLNCYNLAEDPNKRVECEAHEVEHLTIDEYEWLLPIKQPRDRYEFYNQKEKYKTVTTLAVGDRVWLSIPEEVLQSVDQPSCCSATVRYIGPVPEKQGNYFGLELERRLGTCDGTVRGAHYFHCKDLFGTFLPANHIISKSAGTSQVPPVSVAKHPHPQKKEEKKGKLLVPGDKSSSGREFREGDRVAVYDCKDKEHIGTVKWAYSEKGIDGYIIGIELDEYVNKKQLFQDHIKGWGHYFKKPDHRNHTYIVMHEMFVSIVGKSAKDTPVDDGWLRVEEDHFKKDTFQPTESVRKAAAEVTKRENKSVASILKESEVARKNIEENIQKQALLDAGVPPEELEEFEEQKKKLQRFQQEKELQDEWKREEERKLLERHKLSDQRGAQTKSSSAIRPEGRPPLHPQHSYEGLVGLERQSSKENRDHQLHHQEEENGSQHLPRRQYHGEIPSYLDARITAIQNFPQESNKAYPNSDLLQKIENNTSELERLKQMQEASGKLQAQLQTLIGELQRENVKLKSETEENTRNLNQSREENKRLNNEHKKMKEEYHTLKQDHDQFASSLEEMQKENQILRESKIEVERYLTERISLLEKQVETMQPSWNINPTKLIVTDEELGRGAYGEVKVGMYCGSRVAVKRVHQVIISDYNRDQFKREMQIVSRLRHPHLVLFIGAVTTGTLTIVTELMETSLRKQLELGRISEEHILPISRDVACALNYLHSLPEPIIHRDVSSANVLLNSKPVGGWMAKLGDFGSANFLAQLRTEAPGCVAYAAPECQTPALQGPKMDVYSFGILLFEMFTGKLPDPDRVHLLCVAPPSGSTAKQAITEIAKICVCQKVDDRPNMAAIYARLGQI